MVLTEKPGKPGRPKKEASINSRTMNVYLPTLEMKEEWKAVAKAHNQSFSKFIIERVEESMIQNGEGPRHTRKELIDRNRQMERENEMLRKDLEIKTMAYDVLDRELKNLRSQPFINPAKAGLRKMSVDLVKILRQRKRLDYNELLPTLKIKPTEQDLVSAVNHQIELLTDFGIIKTDTRGWKWIE